MCMSSSHRSLSDLSTDSDTEPTVTLTFLVSRRWKAVAQQRVRLSWREAQVSWVLEAILTLRAALGSTHRASTGSQQRTSTCTSSVSTGFGRFRGKKRKEAELLAKDMGEARTLETGMQDWPGADNAPAASCESEYESEDPQE